MSRQPSARLTNRIYSGPLKRNALFSLRILKENIILHQDNAPSHSALKTQLDIDIQGF